jgi:predicted outer membrane repeat protein
MNNFHKIKILTAITLVFLIGTATLLVTVQPAQAAGTVTDCSTYGPGVGTLQHALSGGGTVTFACSGTIIVPEIAITADTPTVIDATGQNVTLSGNNTNRVFLVNNSKSLTLRHITVANGSNNLYGGGVYVSDTGSLTVEDTTFTGNTASQGGAIYDNSVITMTITDSTITGNSSSSYGGGIYIRFGNVAINNSTINGNSANNDGGGIYIGFGDVKVNNSTINDNSAINGGGIHNGGMLYLINSTVSHNMASNQTDNGSGGGIFNSETLTVTNSTISDNTAYTSNGGIANNVGSTLTLHNSIVANNVAPSHPDCYTDGTATAQNSLEETGTPGQGCLNGPNNLNGDPNLGHLQDNGGPTETHALLHGSIAINAGDNGLAVDPDSNPLLYDQRGAGYPRILGGTVDMGAFEQTIYTLTVTKDGTGSGTVTSSPTGIDCGTDCSESFVAGTVVTLTTTVDTGSTFTGWSGACTGMGDCILTMDAAKSVTATFTLEQRQLDITLAGNGSGSVNSTPAGIACPGDCSELFDYGTVVTLTATADTGSTFVGWTGASCSGTGTCVITMDAAKSVTATFTQEQHPLDVTLKGNGSGSVSSAPAGIACPGDCNELFNYGTVVTLTATAGTDSTFTGWTGAGCSGTGTCVVTMDAVKSVTATFTIIQYKFFLPLIFKP